VPGHIHNSANLVMSMYK